MVTYWAKFIPNFRELTELLRGLKRNNVFFDWKKWLAEASDKIKAALKSETVMAYFDQTKETELISDASLTGLFAILAQVVPKSKQKRIIAYISRSLSDVERWYSQTEREALAIVWAVERLLIYMVDISLF